MKPDEQKELIQETTGRLLSGRDEPTARKEGGGTNKDAIMSQIMQNKPKGIKDEKQKTYAQE